MNADLITQGLLAARHSPEHIAAALEGLKLLAKDPDELNNILTDIIVNYAAFVHGLSHHGPDIEDAIESVAQSIGGPGSGIIASDDEALHDGTLAQTIFDTVTKDTDPDDRVFAAATYDGNPAITLDGPGIKTRVIALPTDKAEDAATLLTQLRALDNRDA